MKTNNKRIFEVDYENYERDVIEASYCTPILVDLWAEWCPPCLVITPILEDLVNDADDEIRLAKVEVDEGLNMKIAGRYQVRGFPTILLMNDGRERARFSGARSRSFVEAFIRDSS